MVKSIGSSPTTPSPWLSEPRTWGQILEEKVTGVYTKVQNWVKSWIPTPSTSEIHPLAPPPKEVEVEESRPIVIPSREEIEANQEFNTFMNNRTKEKCKKVLPELKQAWRKEVGQELKLTAQDLDNYFAKANAVSRAFARIDRSVDEYAQDRNEKYGHFGPYTTNDFERRAYIERDKFWLKEMWLATSWHEFEVFQARQSGASPETIQQMENDWKKNFENMPAWKGYQENENQEQARLTREAKRYANHQ
jgi:hypothetical protein